MSIGGDILLSARRAWKPFELHWRSVAVYAAILCLLFLVLILVRLWLGGPTESFRTLIVSVIDNLAAAVLAALVAAVLLFAFFPKTSLQEELAVLDSWNINPALRAPLGATQTYYFRGRSGRWIRTYVLHALFAAATRESVTRSLHLILPDPQNQTLLASYATYRNSLSSGKTDVWTPERIRNEILATILEAGRLASSSTFFETHVTLQSEFSLLRADLSDQRLVLTREEQHLPGWMSSSGSKFYASYLEDLRMAERRGKSISWSSYQYPSVFQEADLIPAIQGLGLTIALGQNDAGDILKAMESRKAPYV